MQTDRNHVEERAALIRELRKLVLNYDGNIEESPHYNQLARLLVSECIIEMKA